MRHLLIAAFLLSSAAVAAAQDVIRFKDGTADQECEVQNLTYKVVNYEISAGNKVPQTCEAKRVAEIGVDKSQTTFDYNQGVAAMEGNNFKDAVDKFARVMRDNRARDLVKQTAGINAVRCYFWDDNVPGCMAAIQALRQLKPDTFYYKESCEYEIKCYLRKSDLNGAQGAVTALETKGNQENLPEWARAADVLRGELFERQKKFREALSIYRRYAAEKDQEISDNAKQGELRCLKETGDWAGLSVRSQAILTELRTRKSANDRLWTAAYNGSGEALLNGGKPKEALLEFMQGVSVYSRGGASPENEASIGRAGYCCTRLAIAEKDKPKKDGWKMRAMELESELTRQYGKGSPYAAELRKAIAEVK